MASKQDIARMEVFYGTTSDEDIREALLQCFPVVAKNAGLYRISNKVFCQVLEEPRSVSYQYDPGVLVEEVTKLKTLFEREFLVKSTSRFVLRPDAGEVFDQVEPAEYKRARAFLIVPGSEVCTNKGEFDEFVITVRFFS